MDWISLEQPQKSSQRRLLRCKELCDLWEVNKKQKIGAKRAHQIILDMLISKNSTWH